MTASRRAGYLCGLVAYLWWGLVPLYFRALGDTPAAEILAHRIAWSIPLMMALTALLGAWGPLGTALRSRKVLLTMLLSGGLLALNWYLYIYATVTHRVSEAALGYYMMPLVNAFFGMVFLGERLRKAHWPALALIVIGVAIPFVERQTFTWLAVALPVTFGFYGLMRKIAAVDSMTGLTLETLLLGLPSLTYIGWQVYWQTGRFGTDANITWLLGLGGVITVVPLLAYILSIRRLPLVAVSFIQFVSPTLQMILAVGVFGESRTFGDWAAMVCVWVAVAIFITDAVIASQGERLTAQASVRSATNDPALEPESSGPRAAVPHR